MKVPSVTIRADPHYPINSYISSRVHRVIYSTFRSAILTFKSNLKANICSAIENLLLKLIPYKALSKQIETTKIQTVIGLMDGVLSCHHTTVSGKGIHGYGKGDAGPVHPEHKKILIF